MLDILRSIHLHTWGIEYYIKEYTLFKLILGVAHISVNYQRIHNESIYESSHVLKGQVKGILFFINYTRSTRN